MSTPVSRRRFVTSLAGAAASATLAGRRAAAAPARKPNVIVILTDDQGYYDVGFNGCADIPTPNLDRLALEGRRCTDGYVSHPFCSPTRAGLLTGRYQQRFGHENNPIYDPADQVAGLDVAQATLPQVLKGAGYVTGHVGKWHLGAAPQYHPLRRGFDEMHGFIGGGHDYFRTVLTGEAKEYTIPLQHNGEAVALEGYLTDVLSEAACDFVRRHRDQPFFLYLAYNAPHAPLQASEQYLARFAGIEDRKRKPYAAMVSAVDDGVGRLSAALKETGQDQNTLVVYLSDNGGPIGERGNGSRNDPLRAGKGAVYEGGTRVPFAVRWSGVVPQGEYHEPVISLDLFPTAAALAGATLPEGVRLDGVDILPHLTGQAAGPPHERLFWRTGGGGSYAVREGRWKLVKPGRNAVQLFDLAADIGETTDLSAAQPEVVKRLSEAYEAWNRANIAPRFQSPPQPPPRPQPQRPGA